MPRSKIDVQQINFSEAVSQDVVFSGSVKLANLGPKGNTLIIDADGQVSGSDFITIDATNNRIGVFTRTPQEAFHIHGNNATLRLGNGTNSGEHSVKLELSEQATAGGEMNYGFSVGYNGSSNDFEIRRYQNGTAGTNIMTINRASNLTTLRNDLDVGGTVDITGSLMVTGSTHLSGGLDLDFIEFGDSSSIDAKVFAANQMRVGANNNLSFTIQTDGNVKFENAVTSSHFKVEGSGGQFVAHNEDTVKLKHVNWYSSNDRQYGQGQLWYQQWFGAIEPSNAGAQGGRRIGFFFDKPNFGASDADGGTSAHPTNTHMYLDRTGMFLQTGSLEVHAGNLSITGSGGTSGPASFEDYVIAELSIPGLDLQTDTNAFRFNCPYGLVVEGLTLYLDQHTTSGNVTVTVTNTTDTNQMISLSITGTNTSATTTTVSNATCGTNDVITFAITATPANAQGLRANLRFRRNI